MRCHCLNELVGVCLNISKAELTQFCSPRHVIDTDYHKRAAHLVWSIIDSAAIVKAFPDSSKRSYLMIKLVSQIGAYLGDLFLCGVGLGIVANSTNLVIKHQPFRRHINYSRI